MPASGPPASPAALVGTTVGNSFVLEKLLAQGRHGALFEARHARLGQRYAVRVLTLDAGRRAALVGAMAQCAGVVHPNLVPVREVLSLSDEQLALCAPLLPGLNLSQWVEKQGKLTAAEGAVMLRQAASGLHALHLRGLVHGGLGPGNLFFVQHDDIAVDNALGSSKRSNMVQLLDAGLHLSTMQPGQAPPSAADDQLALGKLLLSFVEDLSQGQRRVIERTQEARPEARYPSVLELWQAFEAARAPGKIGPTGSVSTALVPQIRVQRAVPVGNGRRSIVIAASALVGLSVVLGLVIARRGVGRDASGSAAGSAPAAEPQVHLAFDVTPPGATVSANGRTGPAASGLTVPRSDSPLTVQVSADGYQTKSVPVIPSSARTIAVTLTRAGEGPSDGAKPATNSGDDDGDDRDKKHRRRDHRRHHSKDKGNSG